MKHTTLRKLAGLAAIVTLASCTMLPMGITASAEDTYSITVSDSNANVTIAGQTYTAYKVFALSYSGSGDSMAYTYSLDDSCLNGTTGYGDTYHTTDAKGNLTINVNDNNSREFADYLYNTYIKGKTVAGTVTQASATAGENDTATITLDEPGYYIVVGSGDAVDGGSDVQSLVILDTAAPDVTVNTKLDAPTLEKLIEHNETGEWGVVGDNQIGDTVNYKINTTMPDPDYVDDFDSYVYTIHDTMTQGLDFDADSVEVKIGDVTLTLGEDYTISASCNHTETALKTGQTAGDSFEIVFDMDNIISQDDTKAAAVKGATITTTYSCTLTADALVASSEKDDNNSNDNTAYLEFSNNPYDDTTTGKTPEDTVYDWTFTYDVTKYANSVADGNELAGAVFSLYEGNAVVKFTDAGNNVYVADPDGTVTQITTPADGHFQLKGLDDAVTYTLKEIDAPDGYNLCADEDIIISNTYDGTPAGQNIATLVANTNEELSTDIINKSGSSLPSTGGIGTTLFYVVGGTMAVGAGVYLIAKKRMNNNEE